MVARPVPAALRTFVVASLLAVVAACSGGEEPDPGPGPSSPTPTPSAAPDELDVVVTDPGGTADPGRVASLTETVSALLAAGTGAAESCPLGDPSSFVHAPVVDARSLSTTVRTSGTAGQVPTVACTSIGSVEAEVSRLPGGTTLTDVVDLIASVTMRPTFSTPQPLLGGQAVVGCGQTESSDLLLECGITWVLDELSVHVTVSGLGSEPQQLADYLSAALPAWVAAR